MRPRIQHGSCREQSRGKSSPFRLGVFEEGIPAEMGAADRYIFLLASRSQPVCVLAPSVPSEFWAL
jgi:hypothetical protein